MRDLHFSYILPTKTELYGNPSTYTVYRIPGIGVYNTRTRIILYYYTVDGVGGRVARVRVLGARAWLSPREKKLFHVNNTDCLRTRRAG